MNTPQNIARILRDKENPDMFESSFTDKEKVFIQRLEESDFLQSIKFGTAVGRKSIIIFDSSTGEQIAFLVNVQGFSMSTAKIYKRITSKISENTFEEYFVDDNTIKIVKKEIEEIKKLFLSYPADDVEQYFK